MRKLLVVAVVCALAELSIAQTPSRADRDATRADTAVGGRVQEMQRSLGSLRAQMDNIERSVNAIRATLAVLDPDSVAPLRTGASKIHGVSTVIHTRPNNGEGQPLNLDSAAHLQFGRIKRYTVTIDSQALSGARRGTDGVYVFTGVVHGHATTDVLAGQLDPASRGGLALPPYSGTNSFIKIVRGNDGLGPVDVPVNAFIETLP